MVRTQAQSLNRWPAQMEHRVFHLDTVLSLGHSVVHYAEPQDLPISGVCSSLGQCSGSSGCCSHHEGGAPRRRRPSRPGTGAWCCSRRTGSPAAATAAAARAAPCSGRPASAAPSRVPPGWRSVLLRGLPALQADNILHCKMVLQQAHHRAATHFPLKKRLRVRSLKLSSADEQRLIS